MTTSEVLFLSPVLSVPALSDILSGRCPPCRHSTLALQAAPRAALSSFISGLSGLPVVETPGPCLMPEIALPLVFLVPRCAQARLAFCSLLQRSGVVMLCA